MILDIAPGAALVKIDPERLTVFIDGELTLDQMAEVVGRLREAAAEETSEPYPTEHAIQIAQLWRAGKLIGGDPDAVRDALLAEVERLRGTPKEMQA